jgi:cytochrome bd ubiquinol oxidase subunit II
MDLNTIWFFLFGVLIVGYAVLDGFDLGVGILHLFTRDAKEKRIHLNAIGPVWDGNEVWLVTAGGALFAAFPIVYATIFSGFYLAMMLVLLALIARAVSIEFRGAIESPRWQGLWDKVFGLGSLLATLLFGVAVGNILRGVPIDGSGQYVGSFLGLLNPFSLLVGLLAVLMFTIQGASYLTMKGNPVMVERMRTVGLRLWPVFIAGYIGITTLGILYLPHLFSGLVMSPMFFLFAFVFLVSTFAVPGCLQNRQYFGGFLASSGTIIGSLGLAATSLYPRLVPSILDPEYSLTVYNASASPRALYTMLIIAIIGMPLVIGYTIFIYRTFRGEVVLEEDGY